MKYGKLYKKNRGPPLKTKYNLIIDSEKYCEGKIEKCFGIKNDEIVKLNTKIN